MLGGMSICDFETLDEAVEHFKKLRAKYALQRKRLKESHLSNIHLDNLRDEIINLGKLLEGNNVDVCNLK